MRGTKGQESIESGLASVERELGRVAAELTLQMPVALKPFGEALGAYVRRPGKRIRARLCLVGEGLFSNGRHSAAAVHTAMALELVHAFLLIHDDVMDQAETRRGEPALHVALRNEQGRKAGEDLAIVAGDWLYTNAMRELLRAPGLAPTARLKLADLLLDVCAMTAQGQALDIVNGNVAVDAISPDCVLETYRLKTGRYTFEAPLLSGALIARAPDERISALRDFSVSAGVAYQLVDDILGLFASDEALGKPAVSDLAEGKKTWLVVGAYARASATDRAWLAGVLARRDAGVAELERARALVRSTGILDEALSLTHRLLEAASRHLSNLPASTARRELSNVVDSIESATRALSTTCGRTARAR